MNKKFNGVMIIPTGLGCSIGGNAGDANPVAKLIAKCCDKLIVHPNVVNASDINEMPENVLYVEGSILDRFLQGKIFLEEINYNRILVVANEPVSNNTINSINASKVTIGTDIQLIPLKIPLTMEAFYDEDGRATGRSEGVKDLIKLLNGFDFEYDALAIHSEIKCNPESALHYLRNGGVNLWGGIEAEVSSEIATAINKPVAHAPTESEFLKTFDEVVDKRISAEIVSTSYLHCVLKGLHKAPRITTEYKNNVMSVKDIDFLISPFGCFDVPHRACVDAGIPIIVVKENKTIYNKDISKYNIPKNKLIFVENYLEAVGVIMAMKSGTNWESVLADKE